MASNLPDYLASARPVPKDKRAPWYLNVAQTYASVMLWFVFWQGLAGQGESPGGTLAAGLPTALFALILAGLICHFLFYLVPGLLGMQTGLPLYVVGTSTYGARGGLIMPGLLMGLLQFGWIGVNAYAVSELLYKCFGMPVNVDGTMPGPNVLHAVMAILFAVGVAFVGLKGIQYVARVASFFPLIPLAVLVLLAALTVGGLGGFSKDKVVDAGKTAQAREAADLKKAAAEAQPGLEKEKLQAKADKAAIPKSPLSGLQVVILLCTVVVGFFATAGAAGADLAMNSRNATDVQYGGLTGIALATVVAGGLTMLAVAGAYGAGRVPDAVTGNLNPLDLMKEGILSPGVSNTIMILLAISSFPGGCFSAYIAATSFKTTMPKVNPFLSVGLGTLISIVLAVTTWAGKVVAVFQVIGASFGPICGAMAADYLLSGKKWAGPRAGFNPAGWISWAVGFLVGAAGFYWPKDWPAPDRTFCPPVAAFVVGFVLYYVLAKAGLESKSLGAPPPARQAKTP
jgi:cytosine permease